MKMMVWFRRRPDLTAEQFRQHYENQHAPLARRLFPYLADYKRHYIRHDLTHRRAAGEALAAAPAFDAVTEIAFHSESDYRRMVSDMTDAAIREQVVSDEERFLDRSATVVFLLE